MPHGRAVANWAGIILALSLTLMPGGSVFGQPRKKARPPRLVVQITVDQLRGDMLSRLYPRFSRGGFRALMNRGIHFNDAHYLHANTETAPGHASLVTGATPAGHGIVANDWIDRKTGAFVYNTEDDRHHILGSPPKPHEGVSPRNLLASTIGDEIVLESAGRSRVFSVSPKDRGAILPGGHAGKAFWYSKRSGQFVTSSFYYDSYPMWAREWNEHQPAIKFRGQQWTLLHDRETYIARDHDDRPFEADFDALGRTFPHPLGDGSSKYFHVVVGITPMVDALAVDFTKTLVTSENLGLGGHLDYLAVSLSSADYAGHLFGIGSLEYEDAVLRIDGLIADLLAHVDERVGLDRTLVVLSADHGGVEAPEYLQSLGFEAGRHPLDWFRRHNPIAGPLQEQYGRTDFLSGHSHPYLYLNEAAISQAGLQVSDVERFVAREVMKLPGILFAVTRTDLLAGSVPQLPVPLQVLRSFHPSRSGNIHLVQDQHWFVHSTEEAEQLGIANIAAIHGSPWNYDTYVPIIFAGTGIEHRIVSRRVSPYDIAPTLALYLGINPPSGSIGTPLPEVTEKFIGGRFVK